MFNVKKAVEKKELKIGGYQELALRIEQINRRIGDIESKCSCKVKFKDDVLNRLDRLEANAKCCSNGFQNEEHDCQKKPEHRNPEPCTCPDADEPHVHHIPEPCSHDFVETTTFIGEENVCKRCGKLGDKPTTKDDYIRIPISVAKDWLFYSEVRSGCPGDKKLINAIKSELYK